MVRTTRQAGGQHELRYRANDDDGDRVSEISARCIATAGQLLVTHTLPKY